MRWTRAWCWQGDCINELLSRQGGDLVGHRIQVYWPGEDAFYRGCVAESRGEMHVVDYDDGDCIEESLGGVETPYWYII